MAIEDFEELLISSFINVTSFGWAPPTLTANFGGGYGAGAIVAPYGLRRWSLQADALPDSEDYTIEHSYDGDDYTSPRFTYFFEFFQRHLLRGNKPFIILDPRTSKKFLVGFPESVVQSGFDAAQITASVLSGGTSLVERRAEGIDFNEDGSIDLDYIRPMGSLSISQNGGKYAGTVTVTASVSDNVAVERVEFYIDYELLSTDFLTAYTAIWDTTAHKNGKRKVRAKVYDTSGNVLNLSTVVTVENDTTPPTVSIWTPTSGATVSGTIPVTAIATDDVEVDRVEFFYFDGLGFAPFGIDSAAPYTVNFNTTTVDNGELVLAVTAFDTAGNPSAAAFVTVTVENELEFLIEDDGDFLTDDEDNFLIEG